MVPEEEMLSNGQGSAIVEPAATTPAAPASSEGL